MSINRVITASHKDEHEHLRKMLGVDLVPVHRNLVIPIVKVETHNDGYGPIRCVVTFHIQHTGRLRP